MFVDKYHPGTGIVHLMGTSARPYNVMVVWGKNDKVFPGIVAAERPMGWGRARHYPSLAPAGRLDAALSKLRFCTFHTWRKCMDANRLQNLGVREKPETILIWMDHISLYALLNMIFCLAFCSQWLSPKFLGSSSTLGASSGVMTFQKSRLADDDFEAMKHRKHGKSHGKSYWPQQTQQEDRNAGAG